MDFTDMIRALSTRSHLSGIIPIYWKKKDKQMGKLRRSFAEDGVICGGECNRYLHIQTVTKERGVSCAKGLKCHDPSSFLTENDEIDLCILVRMETYQIPEVHPPSICLFNRFVLLSSCTHISKMTQTFDLPGSCAAVFPNESF